MNMISDIFILMDERISYTTGKAYIFCMNSSSRQPVYKLIKIYTTSLKLLGHVFLTYHILVMFRQWKQQSRLLPCPHIILKIF